MTQHLLNRTEYDGPTDHRPCLIAHGLFGSARNWNAIAKRLSQTRTVFTVDMRNHGQSFWSDTHSYIDLAGDLARSVDDIGRGPLDIVGHSMGGKAAMALALERPDCVSRLVIGDISPVAYTHSQSQFIDAMQSVDLSDVSRRSEAADQLAKLGVEPALQSFFTQSLDISEKRWRMNLDVLSTEMHKILSFPNFETQFEGACLFLSGANSTYVVPEYRTAIKSLFPHARFAKIPGAGHWLHAEKPKEFLSALEVFLD